GTPIAIDFYERYPTGVKGLILISPALEHKLDDNPFAKTFSNPLIRGTVSLFKNLLARSLEGGLDESWYDTSKITEEIRAEYKKITRIDDWEKALIELTLNQGDFDMLPALTQIDCPVLIIYGNEDKIVPYEKVIEGVKNNQNITVVAIEASGHVPHEETPQIVINTISEWLAEKGLW
ncbi:MAG: alpha/beta fold hydrolase, partial [Thermotogota bacterium]